MKHGPLIIVLTVLVELVVWIVQPFNVQSIHIVDICTNQKMNVVPNVEVEISVNEDFEWMICFDNRLFK